MMCSKGDSAAVCPGGSCRVIEVPRVEDCLQPVINVVPLQVLICFDMEMSIYQVQIVDQLQAKATLSYYWHDYRHINC